MNYSKLVGFIQGVFYPVAMVILTYVIQNLGPSDLVSAGTATIITGLLSVLENYIQSQTGKAMFGIASANITYSQD